ncbi:polysulfide reductase NrfD [bacterium]|nr:polysulfide reductase NrfD [bacterium]
MNYNRINTIVYDSMQKPSVGWFACVLFAILLVGMGVYALYYQVLNGMEGSGINHPIGWGVYITNFVFWIGIAHAGTLISAIMYLTRAPFRNSICRASEAMTVFAIMTAGLFPIIHLGRIWNFYWLFPYSNQRQLWINFKSPLVWDLFAISVYLLVSFCFFYVGLIPDLATIRDKSKGWKRKIYGILALGFRGASYQWLHYIKGYLLVAALATPLVISVHSIVSWDFAISSIPGWHSTIFAPYFVAGAIFSGSAMVLTIMIPLRRLIKGFDEIITIKAFEGMAKVILLTGMIITLSYGVEFFMSAYSGSDHEKAIFWYRPFGEYRSYFWLMICCNCVIPLLFWFRKVRTDYRALFVISILINIGMWLERFVIVVTSLAHDFLPSTWGSYRFEWVEIWITIGSFGWFFFWFLLFLKSLPSLAISEIKEKETPPLRNITATS